MRYDDDEFRRAGMRFFSDQGRSIGTVTGNDNVKCLRVFALVIDEVYLFHHLLSDIS